MFDIFSFPLVVHYPETNITSVYDSYSYLKSCINNEGNGTEVMRPCIFGVFPTTNQTQILGSRIHRKLFVEGPQPRDPRMKAPEVQYFESEEEFRREMNKDPTLLFAAIKFSDIEVGHTNYTLFINGTLIPVEYSRTAPKHFSSGSTTLSNSTLYSSSGFLAIQQTIDASIIELNLENEIDIRKEVIASDSSYSSIMTINNTNGVKMNTRMQFIPGFPAPKMTYLLSIFSCSLQTISSVPFIAVCLIHLVNESTSKTKEYLSMLGLKKSVYWMSWFITFIIPAFIIAVFGTILNYAFSIFSGEWLMIFAFYLLFELSCVLFSFFASTVVNSSM